MPLIPFYIAVYSKVKNLSFGRYEDKCKPKKPIKQTMLVFWGVFVIVIFMIKVSAIIPIDLQISFNTTKPTSDEDFLCIGDVTDPNLPNGANVRVDAYITGFNSGNGGTLLRELNCTLSNFSCRVLALIPNEQTYPADNITCEMVVHPNTPNQKSLNSTITIINRAPTIENLIISPDFYKIYNRSDWVRYSDVFERDLLCSASVEDPDSENEKLFVNFTLYYDYLFEPDRVVNILQECDNFGTCNVFINRSDIWPSMSLNCTAFALDQHNESSQIKNYNMKLPKFNIMHGYLAVYNVADVEDLIYNKSAILRSWSGFDSDLIDELDFPVKVKFYQDGKLLGSVNNFYVRNWPLISDLKRQLNSSVQLTLADTLYANDILLLYKNAKDSANLRVRTVNLPKPNVLDYSTYFDSSINEDRTIKESTYWDNNFSGGEEGQFQKGLKKYVLRQVKNFNITFAYIYNCTRRPTQKELADFRIIAHEQYQFLISASPFVKEKTPYNIQVWRYCYHTLRGRYGYRAYNGNWLTWKDGVWLGPRAFVSRQGIFSILGRYMKNYGVDSAVGVVEDYDNLYVGINGLARYVLSRSIVLNKNLILDRATYLHEFQHAITKIPSDEYTSTAPGVIISSEGWSFNDLRTSNNPSIRDISEGPRINIWTEDGPNAIFPVDYPPTNRADAPPFPSTMALGDRYYDIMGNSVFPNVWIGKNYYNQMLWKLEEKGYFDNRMQFNGE